MQVSPIDGSKFYCSNEQLSVIEKVAKQHSDNLNDGESCQLAVVDGNKLIAVRVSVRDMSKP